MALPSGRGFRGSCCWTESQEGTGADKNARLFPPGSLPHIIFTEGREKEPVHLAGTSGPIPGTV